MVEAVVMFPFRIMNDVVFVFIVCLKFEILIHWGFRDVEAV